MNTNDSKVPIYIAIIVAIILVATGSYFVLGGNSGNGTPPEETPVSTPEETPEVTGTVPSAGPVETPPPPEATIKCELCHTNANQIDQHINGGRYCVNCHGSQVHNIHIGPGTVGLNCDSCHGFPPVIPQVEEGEGPGHYIVCENCHAAPPNSLEPSNGDLIVVHLSRGKYCTNCHGTDIASIHQSAISQ